MRAEEAAGGGLAWVSLASAVVGLAFKLLVLAAAAWGLWEGSFSWRRERLRSKRNKAPGRQGGLWRRSWERCLPRRWLLWGLPGRWCCSR